MKRLIQFFIFTFFTLNFLLLSCIKDEPEINTDISVSSNVSEIYWSNLNDLHSQVNNAFVFNYGNATQDEIETNISINTSLTLATATIKIKEQYQDKYNDPNPSNNTATITLIPEFDDPTETPPTPQYYDLSNTDLSDFTPIELPLKIYIIRKDDGTGDYVISETEFYNYLDELNADFAPAKITFVVCGEINYIDNTTYYHLDNNAEENELGNIYDVENFINVYFYGYGVTSRSHFPYDGIDRLRINTSQLINRQSVFQHELGHYLDLLHTHETGYGVEYVNGSNCHISGDLLCDTPADPQLSTYNVNNNCEYIGNETDPNGDYYSSHPPLTNNIMSYATQCRTEFTNNQLERAGIAARVARNYLNFDNCQSSTGSIIQITPNNLNFGNIQIGTTSSQQSFTVTNTGTSSFSITDFIVPTGFTLVNGQSTTVNPNSSLTFYVTFNPTNVQSYSGVLEVINTADNASSSTSTVYLSGNGVNNNTSNISLSGNLNFGNLPIGQTDTRTFTISNTGNQSFYVSSINFPYSVYSANWNSGTINPNNSQTVTVTFQPTNQQSYNGNVTVNSNATNGNNTIPISGTGINTGQPNLVYSDYRIEIDDNNNGIVEAGEDIDFDIEVHNIGNADAHNVDVYFDTNNPYINITDHSQGYGTVSQGSYDWNSGNLDFEVDPNCPSGPVYFTAHFTSDEGSWYSNFSIDVQAQSGNNPIPITPTNSCYDAPTLDINTEYIVNLDLSDGTIGYAPPIDGVSYNGADVQGFWLEFNEPPGYVGPLNIKIYDVSNNFDPVIGLKYSCSGIFYTQWNSTSYVANDNSYGGSETFADYSNNNGYTHRIRIYHYYGYEQYNISFKIKIERP